MRNQHLNYLKTILNEEDGFLQQNNEISNVIYINLTPHDINLNNGTIYKASGKIARVSSSFTDFDENQICEQKFGAVQDLPSYNKAENIFYIVSALVLSAVKNRQDVIAPATGHPDCKRNDKGHILSVPGFVRNI